MFYGMEPEDVTKSSYANFKQSLTTKNSSPGNPVRSGPFRIDTGLKKDPQFQKNESAFFLQSSHANRKEEVPPSRDYKLREHKLANAGSRVMNIDKGRETESQQLRRAERAFYLLPSSHGSNKQGSRPASHQVDFDQQHHLREITGGIDPVHKNNTDFYAG